MVIFEISKKPLKFIIFFVLSLSLGLNIYNYAQNSRLTCKYQLLLFIANQVEEGEFFSFAASTNNSFSSYKTVEIFDIREGKVIKKLSSNAFIENEIRDYLDGITGMYVKAKALPDKGFIIKIPLQASLAVQNQWLTDYDIKSVSEVFILIPELEKAYLLLMDNKHRPLFYNFKGNTGRLLKALSFDPQQV